MFAFAIPRPTSVGTRAHLAELRQYCLHSSTHVSAVTPAPCIPSSSLANSFAAVCIRMASMAYGADLPPPSSTLPRSWARKHSMHAVSNCVSRSPGSLSRLAFLKALTGRMRLHREHSCIPGAMRLHPFFDARRTQQVPTCRVLARTTGTPRTLRCPCTSTASSQPLLRNCIIRASRPMSMWRIGRM
eukprot:1866529-Rhodomonas_salina.1